MFRLSRKFVAMLMLLWLPLSNGSALAATVSMELHRDACQEVTIQEMHHAEAGDHQHQHVEASAAQDQTTSTNDQTDSSCNACGVCHLACSGYLASPVTADAAAQAAAKPATPYLVVLNSITSTPLIPPPLVCA